MTADLPDSSPENVDSQNGRRGPLIADVTIVGRRPKLLPMMLGLLFLAILLATAFGGHGGFLLYLLVPVVLLNVWASLVFFARPPRVMVRDGVFSLRLLPTWETPAANVASFELSGGKTSLAFHDLQPVRPESCHATCAGIFKKHGYHLQTAPGIFTPDQVNEVRTALGMPPQQGDDHTVFITTLQQLTPRLIVTPAIIAANIVVFLLLYGSFFLLAASPGDHREEILLGAMIEWGANYGPLTGHGQWWRLLTSMFLHFGALHLLFNMWILRDIGRTVERLVGSLGFALGFLASGFFGSLASVFWHESIISAGASGAVFGVFGMLLGFVALQQKLATSQVIKDHRTSVIVFLLFNVLIGASIPGIDQAAHLGGFLAGFLCGLVLSCDLSVAKAQRRWRNAVLVALGTSIATLAVIQLPARPADPHVLTFWIEHVEAVSSNRYREVLTDVEQGRATRVEAARTVASRIVPACDGMADSVCPENWTIRDWLIPSNAMSCPSGSMPCNGL